MDQADNQRDNLRVGQPIRRVNQLVSQVLNQLASQVINQLVDRIHNQLPYHPRNPQLSLQLHQAVIHIANRLVSRQDIPHHDQVAVQKGSHLELLAVYLHLNRPASLRHRLANRQIS